MYNFEFVSPTKIYFGIEQQKQLPKLLQEGKYKKILFHYGQASIKKSGLYDEIINLLNQSGIAYLEVGEVEANPKLALIEQTITLCKNEQVDFILAVGGGSVIDSAKAIACGMHVSFSPWQFCLQQEIPEKSVPVGVILTISAAGSELSNSCVITNKEGLYKRGFNHDLLRPLWAVMNPELTYSVPPYHTSCGTVDILMHTLERYLTESTENELILSMNEGLLKSVMQAGLKVLEQPNDYQARATLMLASSLSHNGLTGLGQKFFFTVHKIEHELTGLHDQIAHGAGLAILFLAWGRYVYHYNEKSFARLFKKVLEIDQTLQPKQLILAGFDKLERYFNDLGLPTKLSDVGVSEKDFIVMANKATENNQKTIAGFKNLNVDDLLAIFRLAY